MSISRVSSTSTGLSCSTSAEGGDELGDTTVELGVAGRVDATGGGPGGAPRLGFEGLDGAAVFLEGGRAAALRDLVHRLDGVGVVTAGVHQA